VTERILLEALLILM